LSSKTPFKHSCTLLDSLEHHEYYELDQYLSALERRYTPTP